jgi:hypothetical protein
MEKIKLKGKKLHTVLRIVDPGFFTSGKGAEPEPDQKDAASLFFFLFHLQFFSNAFCFQHVFCYTHISCSVS